MKNRLIHENLDTSFVNLPSLIRYLRRRQFIGSVRVELGDYEAEIFLTAKNQLEVREHDRAAGRISEGDEAFERILIRAREPNGIINVFQAVEESNLPIEKNVRAAEEIPAIEIEQLTVSKMPEPRKDLKSEKVESLPRSAGFPKFDATATKLSFGLNNEFEAKVRQSELSSQDWQTLLSLIAELLITTDQSLAEADLDFTAAFDKARAEMANDYPFLDPSADIFVYQNGKIILREKVNAKLFAASINEALRRILEKLGRNPKFASLHRITAQKILALLETRKTLYDKFFITPQLEKTIAA